MNNGKAIVVGVVSWGHENCSVVGYPSVYARVTDAMQFINETINVQCTSLVQRWQGIDNDPGKEEIKWKEILQNHPVLKKRGQSIQ